MTDSLLLSIPVPFFRRDGRLYVERQAWNGLRLWAENFDSVDVIARESRLPVPEGWIPWDDGEAWTRRVGLSFVPEAFRPDRFLKALPSARAMMRDRIAANEFLCFAIGGLFGDWGAVAAREAIGMGRRYAIWTDRVESDVVRRSIGQGPWKRQLRARLSHRPMAALERYLIRHADLGLFHGADTYEHYAPFSRHAVLVHDVHFARDDIIAPGDLVRKQESLGGGPAELIYAGRVASMKGWRDWLDVMAALHRHGVSFRATWLGGGEDHAAFVQLRDHLGLGDIVVAPGNVDDRGEVRRRLERAHALVFCHLTKESPRVLIEALRSGTPIVGYRSAYAEELISGAGGGRLVPMGDAAAVAREIAALGSDRAAWALLMDNARRDGEALYDEAVFKHRSDVIKTVLGRGVPRPADAGQASMERAPR